MKTFTHYAHSNLIEICDGPNSVTLSVEDFVRYEPTYTLPLDAISQRYSPGDYRLVYLDNGQAYSVGNARWADGDRYISRIDDFKHAVEYDANQVLVSSQQVLDHNKQVDPRIARRAEYPSTHELIIALWESIVEKNHSSLEKLQAKRLEIKAKYPITIEQSKEKKVRKKNGNNNNQG